MLVKIRVETVLNNWKRKCTGMDIRNGNKRLHSLKSADHQLVTAKKIKILEYMTCELQGDCEAWGLAFNLTKKLHLLIGKRRHLMKKEIIKHRENYKYLEINIYEDKRHVSGTHDRTNMG
jgi:hypothetical protein